MRKKILSFLLAAVMMLSAVPMLAFTVFATETEALDPTAGQKPTVSATWTGSEVNYQSVVDIRNNPDYFFFRWYTADDVPITKVNDASAGAIAYGKVNPTVMAAAGITEEMGFREAFKKYTEYLKTLLRVEYTGDWAMAYENGTKTTKVLYWLLTPGHNAFMVSATANQLEAFSGGQRYWVDETAFDTAMNTQYFYATTGSYAPLSGSGNNTPVKDITVPYNNSTSGLRKNLAQAANNYNGAYAPTGNVLPPADLYLRPQSAPATNAMAVAYTASMNGKLSLSMNSLAWYAEHAFPYVAIAVYKNGTKVDLNLDGLNLATLATAMPTASGSANNTTAGNLQAMETGIYYDATTGYLHLKMYASASVPTWSKQTVSTEAQWFKDLQAILANTVIDVQKGDVITVRVNRSNAYDTALGRTAGNIAAQLGLTATTVADTTVSASLGLRDSYTVNVTMTPCQENVTEAGIIVTGENGEAVFVPGVKQADGSYKASVKDLYVWQLVYCKDWATYSGGTTITYTPYEIGPKGYFTYDQKTVNTYDMLKEYMNGDYDSTTKALAKAICALAVSYAYEKRPSGLGFTPTLDSTSKEVIRGTYHSAYVSLTRDQVVEILKNHYTNDATIQAIDENTKFYKKDGTEYFGVKYGHYGAQVNNLILQAYKEYLLPNEAIETLPGDYKIYVGSTDESVAYEIPYYVKHTLTDAEKAALVTKYTNAADNALTVADVKNAENYGYKIVGANVSLGDSVKIAFLANGNGDNSMYNLKNGYKLKITTSTGATYYGDFYTAQGNSDDSNLYMGVAVDMPASFYNDALTAVIVDAEGNEVSARLQYNVLSYCARMYEYDTSYVLRGVYHLGVCAKAYADAHPAN